MRIYPRKNARWTAREVKQLGNPSRSPLIDPGYLHAFLPSPYGYEQIIRFRHGSVIDHVTPDQIGKVLVPMPPESKQKEIDDRVRLAYKKRAAALKLEDEAHEILLRALKGKSTEES